jgi:nucleoside-diphosphate-sugar epimerase
MQVLITGGAGYVGTTLTELLLQQGYRVRVLDSLKFNQWNSLIPFFRNPQYDFVKGDIRDKTALSHALRGVDAVVHLAAIVGFPACNQSPDEAKSVNFRATVALNELRGNIPLIFASTGSVYGKVEDMCSEDTPPQPLTLYGETKFAAEDDTMCNGNAIAYRFATAFGLSSRMRLDLMPNDFTYRLVVDKALTVYQPHARRTFIHVQDMARAILHGLQCFDTMRDTVYNIGDNRLNCTKGELVQLIHQFAPDAQVWNNGNGVDPDMRDYEVNYARINATGFQCEWTLERGIQEMARAFTGFKVPNPFSNAG